MNPASASLTDRIASAGTWRFASALVGAIAQFSISVVLARLLVPADFGVMALAAVVLGFMQPLGDLGIGGAVVQRSELSDRHVRTAFTFSVLFGLATAAALALAAPLAGVAMRDTRVTSVLRVLAVGFALRGTATVAGALLRRRLDFKRQFFIDTGSYVVGYGFVAVSLALNGFGVWSMVWGGLLQALLSSSAQLLLVRHSVRPLFARSELGDLFHFGVGATLSSTVNYVALNGDNFIVGRWIGAASLGLYSRAYLLMNLPFTFAASVMSSVLFPAFAKVQGDPQRLRRGYLFMTRLMALIAAPMMATLAVVAPHLVLSLYGPKWEGTVLPLQVLCLSGYFRALYHLGGIVAQSVGEVYRELKNQLIYAGSVLIGALAGSQYGLPGVAAGVALAIMVMFIATGRLAMRATGTAWRTYFRVQIAGILLGAVTGGVAVFVRLLLEAQKASSLAITIAVLGGAAIPWSLAMIWQLGDPDFEAVRSRMPGWIAGLIEAVRRQPHLSSIPTTASTPPSRAQR
jgi:PST family polysaccharide transporter